MWEVPLLFDPERHLRDIRAELEASWAPLDEQTRARWAVLDTAFQDTWIRDWLANCDCGRKRCVACKLQLPFYPARIEGIYERCEKRRRSLGKQTWRYHLKKDRSRPDLIKRKSWFAARRLNREFRSILENFPGGVVPS